MQRFGRVEDDEITPFLGCFDESILTLGASVVLSQCGGRSMQNLIPVEEKAIGETTNGGGGGGSGRERLYWIAWPSMSGVKIIRGSPFRNRVLPSINNYYAWEIFPDRTMHIDRGRLNKRTQCFIAWGYFL